MTCKMCMTEPVMVEVKPNYFICPVCDWACVRKDAKTIVHPRRYQSST